jgi:hypothetical protein
MRRIDGGDDTCFLIMMCPPMIKTAVETQVSVPDLQKAKEILFLAYRN